MARMPQADWLGEHAPRLSDGSRRRIQRYDIVCYHTIVGYAPAHAAHFSVHQDGTIQQSRDTRYWSAANLEGNYRIIAIENEDHGSRFPDWDTSTNNVPPLTPEQIEANAQILAWAHKEHGVPLQLAPNSRSTSRGLAYHRQGIDGNWAGYKYGGRVSGGEKWSRIFGKGCPGDKRIDQRHAILARAKEIVGRDWFAMADQEDLEKALRKVLSEPSQLHYDHCTGGYARNEDGSYHRVSFRQQVRWAHKRAVENFIMLREMQGIDAAEIAEEVNRFEAEEIAGMVVDEAVERMQE